MGITVLEPRYIVLKIKDVERAALTNDETTALDDICKKIAKCRDQEGKATLAGVFIENDWPEYSPVLNSLTLRIKREQCQHDWKWHQIAGDGQFCQKCGARDFYENY